MRMHGIRCMLCCQAARVPLLLGIRRGPFFISLATNSLQKIDDRRGWVGFIRPYDTTKRDHWGDALWNVCAATVQTATSATPSDALPSGWFPTRNLAIEWQAYIQQ